MDQSSYFAFTASFGMVMGAFTSLSSTALSAARIRPILEMAEPFLKTEPKTSEQKEIVERISGGIEIDHVSFRYGDNTPYVLDDLSLRIRKGEYVAIVGRTGCGKSTLVRLLLGFEKPEKGPYSTTERTSTIYCKAVHNVYPIMYPTMLRSQKARSGKEKSMRYEDLSDEQKKMVSECNSPEEILELAKNEGYTLSDEELEAINGGVKYSKGGNPGNWGK